MNAKTKPTAKKSKWKPPYKTYKSRSIAEFEALKSTCGVSDSLYIATFSIDGLFFFTTTEEDGVALRTQNENEGLGIRCHGIEENDISEAGLKLFRKWYESEVTKEMKRLVPASHPQHKAIWKAHKDIADGSEDGLGGEYLPKALVADSMRMYVNPLEVWKEYLETAVEGASLYGEKAKKAEAKVKEWTKGKTFHECVGATKKEWMSYNVLTDDALQDFAKYLVREELEK